MGKLVKELLPPAPDERIIYVNGEFLPQSKAVISVLDHGLMYGDGCFDAWCGRNGFIFQHEMHTTRLFRSVRALKLDRWLKMTYQEMFDAIVETVRRNVVPDVYIKVLVTRGISSEPVINMRDCKEASVVIFARPVIYEMDMDKMETPGHPDEGPVDPPRLARGARSAGQEPQLPQHRDGQARSLGQRLPGRHHARRERVGRRVPRLQHLRRSRTTPCSPHRTSSCAGSRARR